MPLLIDDVARLAGESVPARRRVKRTATIPDGPAFDRARLVKAATGAAVGVGLASLGLFRLTPPAYAEGYDIYPYTTSGPCADYAVNHECSPGCGPSTVAGGYPNGCNDGVCADCWHRCCGNLGPNGATHYLRPNECWGGSWDGWKWRCSSTVVFRCHDGWACWHGGCGRTVCRINTG